MSRKELSRQVSRELSKSRKQASRELEKIRQRFEGALSEVESAVKRHPGRFALVATTLGVAIGAASAYLLRGERKRRC